MTPTHILIPIADLEKLPILFDNLMPIFNSFPKVDLSEKNIQAEAITIYGSSIYSMHEVDAYKQCAEDLLKIKS